MKQDSENSTQTETFIPVFPDKTRRRGIMISQALPGFVLALSVLGTHPVKVGEYLLNAFCFVSGILVIFFSVREFIFPGKGKKPGTDMVTVFTGLLVIAQGAQVFDALKDFQPAHLYFLAGTIFIFKGVMLPESKIKRGFTISDIEVTYHKSLFRANVKFPVKDLEAVYLKGNVLQFQYRENEIKTLHLKGKTALNELVVALNQELFPE